MSWFSCRDYSKRTSRCRDEPLGTWDRMGHAFHHVICFACRRFSRQLKILDHAFTCIRTELDEEAPAPSVDRSDETLSSDARQRIKEALERERLG